MGAERNEKNGNDEKQKNPCRFIIHELAASSQMAQTDVGASGRNDSYAEHTHKHNVCEVMDNIRCKFFSQHIFSSDTQVYSFEANSLRRVATVRKSCATTKNWKKFFLRWKLKTIHAALSGIDRGTYERNRCYAYTHIASQTADGNVLACCRHKHNFFSCAAGFVFVVVFLVPRLSTEFVLRDSNSDAIRLDAYTQRNGEPVYSTTEHKHQRTDNSGRQLKKSIWKCWGNFFVVFNCRALKFHSKILFFVWLQESEQRKL